MLIFTSINNAYLPKARVLAQSVKKYIPEAEFALLLSDELPGEVSVEDEPFDRIVYIQDLNMPVESVQGWIFKHSVVELCTAVKGPALLKFLDEGHDKVIYMDPDTCLFNDLKPLEKLLDDHPVILTPHMLSPNDDLETIWETEVSCLKHGCYNLGFLAVANNNRGRQFAAWWRDRLVDLCYDDIGNGIFTDQRWVDLAPCLFDFVYILRDSEYNVATWNITKRKFELDQSGNPLVDGKPLRFYHFSGYDNGTDERMSNKYNSGNIGLGVFRKQYYDKINENGQEKYKGIKGFYDFYDDKTPITKDQRQMYKNHKDLQEAFPNPYDPSTYLVWYRDEIGSGPKTEVEFLRHEIESVSNTINEIYASNSYKLAKKFASISARFKRRKRV